MEEKKRFVVQRSLPRGKDAFVQGQYGQKRVVRLRAGTRRRHLHPCRRVCRQHGFSRAGEIHLGGGGWEFRAASHSPTCEGAGFRTRISGGRAENAALRRAERLSLGAGHPLRSGRPPLSAGQLPRTRETLFRHRVSERVGRLGAAQQIVQGVHTAEGYFPRVAAGNADGCLRRVRGILRFSLRHYARTDRRKRRAGA